MKRKSFKFNRVFEVNKKYLKKPRTFFVACFSLIFLIILIFSFKILDTQWLNAISKIGNIFKQISEMFKWNFSNFSQKDSLGYSFIGNVFNSLWITITISVAGTFFGILFAIPFAILASSNIIYNKVVNSICRTILALSRTIPSFVIAILVVGYFGPNYLTLSIALGVTAFSVAGKIFNERIEQVNIKIFTSIQATGANKIKSFKSGILPQISNHLLFTSFYIWETNIKYMAVITVVTKTGLGLIINDKIQLQDWPEAGFAIFVMVLIILFLESIVFILKKYVMNDVEHSFISKNIKEINKKYKKFEKMSNFNLYINQKIIFEFNIQINAIRKKIKLSKNKIEKITLKKDCKNLKMNKKQAKLNFLNFYKNQKIIDNQNYKNQLQKSPIKEKIFILMNKDLVRLDKVFETTINNEALKIRSTLFEKKNNEIQEAKNSFQETLSVDFMMSNLPNTKIRTIVFLIIFIPFLIYCLILIPFKMTSSSQVHNTNLIMWEILHINWKSIFIETENTAYSVMYLMFESLAIAAVGTFIGSITGYILGLLSSEKITNKYVAKFFTFFTNVMRTIPAYIFALLLVTIATLGPFVGMLSLSIGTTWMLGKYNKETFDEMDTKVIDQLKAMGFSKFQVFRYGILPQTLPTVFSYIIMGFDSNFKNVAILGSIGAGNMGFSLTQYFKDSLYGEFGALLLGLIVFTLIIEYLAVVLRAKVLNDKNIMIYDWTLNKIRQKRFSIYKANEKIMLNEVKFDFFESEAFYYFSKLNTKNGLIKKEEFKETNDLFIKKRRDYILELKSNTKKESKNLKINYLKFKSDTQNKLSKLRKSDLIEKRNLKSDLKLYKREFKGNLWFLKKTYQTKLYSLDY